MKYKEAQEFAEMIRLKVIEDILPGAIMMGAIRAGRFLSEEDIEDCKVTAAAAVTEEMERLLDMFMRKTG